MSFKSVNTISSSRSTENYTNVYLFDLQILYGRLLILKSSAKILSVPTPPQPITDQYVPSLSLASTLAISYTSPHYPPSHYYQRALGLCEQLFDGEIDQANFEEIMRQMFGTHAYIIFTVHKICNSVIKLVSLF